LIVNLSFFAGAWPPPSPWYAPLMPTDRRKGLSCVGLCTVLAL